MLSIKQRENNGVVLLDLSGRLVFGPEGQTLAQVVKQLVAEGKKRVVANLAGITYIDSSGVGELVAGFSTMKKSGGNLKLCALPPLVRDVLRIVRVLTMIDAYETEQQALASYSDAKTEGTNG
jgi:anti-sigma B factor antagonist